MRILDWEYLLKGGRQIAVRGIPLAENSRPCFVVGSPKRLIQWLHIMGFPTKINHELALATIE
jgi:hypothetical protein